MAKLPEEVYEALTSESSIKIMATLDKEKVLNAVPIGSLCPISEDMLAFANVFPNSKTKVNLDTTRHAAIAVFMPPLDGYQIKGLFTKWETSGPIFDQLASRVNGMMQQLGVNQKVEAVGTIKVNEVYALSIPVAGEKLA